MFEIAINPKSILMERGLVDPENSGLLITNKGRLGTIHEKVVRCPPTTFKKIEGKAHPVFDGVSLQALAVGESVKRDGVSLEVNLQTYKLSPIPWSTFFALLCVSHQDTELKTRHGVENLIMVGECYYRVLMNGIDHSNKWIVIEVKDLSEIDPRPGFLMINPVLVEA